MNTVLLAMEGREEALHEIKVIVWTALGVKVPPLREPKRDKSTLSTRLKRMAENHNRRLEAGKAPKRKRGNASQEAPLETTLPPDEEAASG